MSVKALERLTDRIYDAVVEPDAWTDVLAGLVTLAGADQAMLLNASVVTGTGDATFFGNESPAAPVEFQAYYASINPLTRMAEPAAYLANWRPTMIRDEDIVPRAELETTEYYNDFLRPLGAHHGLYLRLDRCDDVVTNVSLGRAARRGRFGEDSTAALAPIYSHLRRAAALRRRFGEVDRFATAAVAALDSAADPMVLLARDGRVVHVNAAADRLLAGGTTLRVVGGRLTAAGGRGAADLPGVIAAAAEPGSRRGSVVT